MAAAQEAPLAPTVAYVVSGGHWENGPSHGHYRLVVVVSDTGRVTSRFLIEWIEETPGRSIVRDSRTASVLGAPWVLDQPRFEPAARLVTASVAGSDPVTARRARWTITLGPPGRFSISPQR